MFHVIQEVQRTGLPAYGWEVYELFFKIVKIERV